MEPEVLGAERRLRWPAAEKVARNVRVNILKEAVEVARDRKWIARSPLLPGGRPMKIVCDVLGVARSTVHIRTQRPTGRVDRSLTVSRATTVRTLQSYGYRRAWAMVNRRRDSDGRRRRANREWVYGVMRDHRLLLRQHTGRPVDTPSQDGRIAVDQNDRRWCSDGFGIACDNRERVRVAFALNCCAHGHAPTERVLEHYNDVHPHRALRMLSPRMFRRARLSYPRGRKK